MSNASECPVCKAPLLVSGSGRLVLIQVAVTEPLSFTRKQSTHLSGVSSIRRQKTPARQGSPLVATVVFLPGTACRRNMALCHARRPAAVKHETETSRQRFRPCIVPGTTRKHADKDPTALPVPCGPSGPFYLRHSYQRRAFQKPGDNPGRGLPVRPLDALPN